MKAEEIFINECVDAITKNLNHEIDPDPYPSYLICNYCRGRDNDHEPDCKGMEIINKAKVFKFVRFHHMDTLPEIKGNTVDNITDDFENEVKFSDSYKFDPNCIIYGGETFALPKDNNSNKVEPFAFVQFNREGKITHSKNIQGVLRTGVGEYTINPTDEERHNQYRKEHPTRWDKFKGWFKR